VIPLFLQHFVEGGEEFLRVLFIIIITILLIVLSTFRGLAIGLIAFPALLT
jgi:hypothetical protein